MIRARTDSIFSSARERGAKRNSKSIAGQHCSIILLDGRDLQLEINKKTTGQWIFDYVVDFLKIEKRDYFGILYEDEHSCQQWLELVKPVRKQTKKNITQLFFSIRYYPIDPLEEDPTIKAQVYWQVKRDFVDGRLPCTPTVATQLCGYIAQAELCDWLEPREQYLLTLGLSGSVEFQRMKDDIIEKHKEFKGMTPLEAMTAFLDISSRFDFYGMIFFEVKYEEKLPHVLGISPHGLSLCKEFVVLQSFPWNRIIQVSYKGKKFTLKVHSSWASNSKPSSVHFDVDSTRTCKELYDTFVEHINFYKDLSKNKPQVKGPTQIQLPSSISTDMLSQMLLKSIENEEERREQERHNRLGLHRSLSLPRNAKHGLSPLHPLTTALHPTTTTPTTTIDPIAKALLLKRQRSDGSSSNGRLSSHRSDRQSAGSHASMHDSLLDLADDLGGEDDDTCPSSRQLRSNSNPEITYHSTGIPSSKSCDELDLRPSPDCHVTSTGDDLLINQRKKNRILLQNWVKEQKKKNLTSAPNSPSPKEEGENTNVPSQQVITPYKLTGRTQSFSPEESSSGISYPYYRPNSATASTSYQIEDLYSIPRPSPAPSPGFFRRPHPFSTSSRSDLLIPSRGSSHNDYDIPRSLIDLRNVNNTCTNGGSSTRPASSVTGARSESSLLTGNESSFGGGGANHAPPSHQASLSSIPAVNQISCLRDEYPDYDIPRPQSKDYPDYDIPKPHKNDERSALSFGVLDSVMAEIDDHVAASQKTSSSLPSLIDRDTLPPSSQHIREHSTPAMNGMYTGNTDSNPDPAYDHLAAKIALRQLIADGIIQAPPPEISSTAGEKATTLQDLEKDSSENSSISTTEKQSLEKDSITKVSTENGPIEKDSTEDGPIEKDSTEDVISTEKGSTEKKITEKGSIEKLSTQRVSPVKDLTDGTAQPPNHLVDLTKHLKLSGTSLNLPFDPNFFASQTALERDKVNPQLPPDVAKFMSWVKTGNTSNPETPNSSLNATPQKMSLTMPQKKTSPPLQRKDGPSPTLQKQTSLPTQQQQQKMTLPKVTLQKPSPPIPHKMSPPTQHKMSPPTQHKIDLPTQQRQPPKSNTSPNTTTTSTVTTATSTTATATGAATQMKGREPIYHEITDQEQQQAPPPPVPPLPIVTSKSELATKEEGKESGGGKENKVSPTLQLKKEKSLPLVQNPFLASVVDELPQFSGKRSHSFNIRRPLQIKLDASAKRSFEEESIPGSPSFYTAHPLAGTMPSNDQGQSSSLSQGFKEHLNQIGAISGPVQHHQVVSNWVKGTQKVKDSKVSPSKLVGNSQKDQGAQSSVQLRLGQLPPIKTITKTPADPNAFSDHLYEDPDILLKSTLLQRKATEPVFSNTPSHHNMQSHTMRNRSQSHAATIQRRPYITREHKSSTGTTVYATDV